MKRPSTYVEWREVFQHEVYWFGLCTHTLQQFRGMGLTGDSPILVEQLRVWWRRYRRLSRLQGRLDAEHEAKDDTWCEAIMDWLESDD